MTRLEDDLRATLHRRALDIDESSAPSWASRPLPGHRREGGRRRVTLLATASILVLFVGLAAGFAVLRDAAHQSQPAGTVSGPGEKTVTYRGVELTVPLRTVVANRHCGEVVSTNLFEVPSGAVLLGAPVPKCGDGSYYSDLPLLRVMPSESVQGGELAAGATTPITVGGTRVMTSCGSCTPADLSRASVLYFPDQRVVVSAYTQVTGSDRWNKILSSVRVEPGEPGGCPADPEATGRSASDEPIDGATVCVYGVVDQASEPMGGGAQGPVVLYEVAWLGGDAARDLQRRVAAAPVHRDRPSVAQIVCGQVGGPVVGLVRFAHGGAVTSTVAVRPWYDDGRCDGTEAVRGGVRVDATSFAADAFLTRTEE